jgi:hypothetical protein
VTYVCCPAHLSSNADLYQHPERQPSAYRPKRAPRCYFAGKRADQGTMTFLAVKVRSQKLMLAAGAAAIAANSEAGEKAVNPQTDAIQAIR